MTWIVKHLISKDCNNFYLLVLVSLNVLLGDKKIVKFKWYLSWFLEEKLIIKERRKEREKKKVYKIILDARKRFYYYFIFAFPFLEGETSLQGF